MELTTAEWDEWEGVLTFRRHDTIRAAVVLDNSWSDPQIAYDRAITQRDAWTQDSEGREYVKEQLGMMMRTLDALDMAQSFGWQDRMAEELRTLADQITETACDLGMNAAGENPTYSVPDLATLQAHAARYAAEIDPIVQSLYEEDERQCSICGTALIGSEGPMCYDCLDAKE